MYTSTIGEVALLVMVRSSRDEERDRLAHSASESSAGVILPCGEREEQPDGRTVTESARSSVTHAGIA